MEILINETSFTAYSVYDATNQTPKLDAVVLLNLGMWNSTQDARERPSKIVVLPEEGGWERACVTRLTAPGVEVRTNITYAGQSVDGEGKLVGQKKVESVVDGTVSVAAGEAVLVRL